MHTSSAKCVQLYHGPSHVAYSCMRKKRSVKVQHVLCDACGVCHWVSVCDAVGVDMSHPLSDNPESDVQASSKW